MPELSERVTMEDMIILHITNDTDEGWNLNTESLFWRTDYSVASFHLCV
jgi:hypothetical protein